MKTAILVLLASFAFAQAPKPPAATAEPQVATLKLQLATAQAQAAWYKAQFLSAAARLNDRDSAAAFSSVSCGEYTRETDQQTGAPVCTTKKTTEEKPKGESK